jgi:TolA-binding protein
MKATSLNQLSLLWLPRLPAEEKRLNKEVSRSDRNRTLLIKASFVACLCFFSFRAPAQHVSVNSQTVYDRVLNLQLAEVRKELTSTEPEAQRLLGLCDALELLINEDESLLKPYEEINDQRVSTLSSGKHQSAESLYAQAELSLYWSGIYLKFGREFDAAFHLRKANQLTTQCRKKYPDYQPILKTHGLLQIILGSVPEKYGWLLGVLNMKGNVQKGLAELAVVSNSALATATEATLLLSLIHSYALQQPERAIQLLNDILEKNPSKTLPLFAGASMALKNSQAELALQLLQRINATTIPSVDYFLGEAWLCKGEYLLAAEAFQRYSNTFKGKNFLKDASFKTGLCYLLLQDNQKAAYHFDLARQRGQENSEADKYAGRTLAAKESINPRLTKIRFFIDGGYYDKAREEIRTIMPSDLPTLKELTEFYYRQARLAHKTSQWSAAKLYYKQTIDMSAQNTWYFAPNACLQLGYIAQRQGEKKLAKEYFRQALSYKKHEYKNSIDAKAKSALSQLNDRK